MHTYAHNRQVYDSYSFVAAFLLALSIHTCPHVSPGGKSQRRSRDVRIHTFINPVNSSTSILIVACRCHLVYMFVNACGCKLNHKILEVLEKHLIRIDKCLIPFTCSLHLSSGYTATVLSFCVCSIREFYVISIDIIDKAWHHVSTKLTILIG